MSRVSFNRKRVKLKQLRGIRARLVLLALIVVAPLMLERARSLEQTRSELIAAASAQFAAIAEHSVQAQRAIISSVETVVKSAAYSRASAGGVGRGCGILQVGAQLDLPWIVSLSLVASNGLVECSTSPGLVGVDLGDRLYFRKAVETNGIIFSDYLLGRDVRSPIMTAAYPVSAIAAVDPSVIVAAINLDWMSKVMSELGGRPGVSAVLVDSEGKILAAPSDQAGMIGLTLDDAPLLAAIAGADGLDHAQGSASYLAADGSRHAANFSRIPGTGSRLIINVDEARFAAGVDREIHTAYLQLGFVCLFVLLGALVAAEKIVIQPIGVMAAMAKRFGQGDWSARVSTRTLPAEFVPLARAFNAMAAQLGERERELLATNDRLTVMASIDPLTGLANRRGFQSRLELEWMKAQQYDSELSLLMIDVDHFKLFNDTYGHPEGDACLSRVGEALTAIAADSMGFAARYGGEEFCLLLPNADPARALEIGEKFRVAIERLAMPHATSRYQIATVSIGVAGTRPNDGEPPCDLIEAADAALYAAKHRGRNAVVEHGLVRATDGGISSTGYQ